jgi:hypothetical protein
MSIFSFLVVEILVGLSLIGLSIEQAENTKNAVKSMDNPGGFPVTACRAPKGAV